MHMNRRSALKWLTALLGLIAVGLKFMSKEWFGNETGKLRDRRNIGTADDGYSDIYVIRGDAIEQNVKRLFEKMGGINSLIGSSDVVIIKPNAQWWNQGMTNTNTMMAVIKQIIEIPKYEGEIIIADNHQYQSDESRGWTTNSPNGDYNLNQLVEYFNKKGIRNVTKYQWHCGGPNRGLVQGDAYGDRVVEGPERGDGYVWRQDIVYKASSGRKTMMSYPVFTSKYSGITIDLMKGAYKDGKYLEKKIRFINMPSLNHHSGWGGVTCCIKNYLGIVDMTCGYHGDSPTGFFNFHYVGHSDMNEQYPLVEKIKKRFGVGYIDHFHGGPVGHFMKNVRLADLNIVTANWVGYGSRTDPKLSVKANTILASIDPVALDYYASKYVLLPLTPRTAISPWRELYYNINDPDNISGPLCWYLNECYGEGIGNIDESRMRIHEA
jgi:hypothetical protein